MQAHSSSLDIPGAKRRTTRWRSWWNKQELYPPSVDQWFAQRRAFFQDERAHARASLATAGSELCSAASSASQGNAASMRWHLYRGCVLVFCRPLSVLQRVEQSEHRAWPP